MSHKAWYRPLQVCAADNGYPSNQINLATYVVARLNCSLDGSPPVYFDEIRSSTRI